MKNAIVVDANDVKEILAKHFGVKPDDVIKSQYSYTVVMDNAIKVGTGPVYEGEMREDSND